MGHLSSSANLSWCRHGLPVHLWSAGGQQLFGLDVLNYLKFRASAGTTELTYLALLHGLLSSSPLTRAHYVVRGIWENLTFWGLGSEQTQCHFCQILLPKVGSKFSPSSRCREIGSAASEEDRSHTSSSGSILEVLLKSLKSTHFSYLHSVYPSSRINTYDFECRWIIEAGVPRSPREFTTSINKLPAFAVKPDFPLLLCGI